METIKVSEQKLQEITSFIGEESSRLRAKDVEEDLIFVVMPYWLFRLFEYYHRTTISFSDNTDETNSYFFGCKIQFHFKDEVTIFYRDYHCNRKLFEPKIYTIN